MHSTLQRLILILILQNSFYLILYSVIGSFFFTVYYPDSFWLEQLETEGSHEYGDDNYFIARFNVKRDDFDNTLATVIIVGFPNAGGELSLLSITRPVISSQEDVFEEKIVIQYIESQ